MYDLINTFAAKYEYTRSKLASFICQLRVYMLNGAPPGSVGAANKSGWSNEIIFMQFLEHFISNV